MHVAVVRSSHHKQNTGGGKSRLPTAQSEVNAMICHIYPVASGSTFRWKWRGKDGRCTSEHAFELFYECVEDARDHGVDIDLTQAHLDIADAAHESKVIARPKR